MVKIGGSLTWEEEGGTEVVEEVRGECGEGEGEGRWEWGGAAVFVGELARILRLYM